MSNPILGYRKVSLVANGEKVAPFSGARMVRFFNATANFSIQINGGTWIPMTRGLRVLLQPGDLIEELNLKDTSGDANDIELYFGDVDVADDTLNVVGVESVTISGQIESITNPVSVGNFPASQTVNGTVNVGNLPATQPVSGTVSVGNFPATQPVSGTLNVGNLPATQEVQPKAVSVTLDGASYTTDGNNLTGKRWVKVTNTHGSANVTVTINSITKTLAPSEVYETPQLDQGESLPTVTIDAASSSADAEFLNA